MLVLKRVEKIAPRSPSLHPHPHLLAIRANLRHVHRLPHERERVEGAWDLGSEGVADFLDSLGELGCEDGRFLVSQLLVEPFGAAGGVGVGVVLDD